MDWTESDDEIIQEYLDRLQTQQKNLQSQLDPINIIINNTRKIQTKTQFGAYIVVDNERIQPKITIKPKDKWGDDMTDEYRLKVKDECIAKTNELLV